MGKRILVLLRMCSAESEVAEAAYTKWPSTCDRRLQGHRDRAERQESLDSRGSGMVPLTIGSLAKAQEVDILISRFLVGKVCFPFGFWFRVELCVHLVPFRSG